MKKLLLFAIYIFQFVLTYSSNDPTAVRIVPNINGQNVNKIIANWMEPVDSFAVVDDTLRIYVEETEFNSEYVSTTFNLTEHEAKVDTLRYKTDGWVTPEMFGAVGDGATDDASAFNDMLNYAVTNKKKVSIPNDTFSINSVQYFTDIQSDISIEGEGNAVLDIRNATFSGSDVVPESFFKFTGSIGTSYSLTSNAYSNDTSIVVDNVTGLEVGDYIRIASTEIFAGQATEGSECYFGELHVVKQISGITIVLDSRLKYDYDSGSSYWKMYMPKLELKNLTIIGDTNFYAIVPINMKVSITNCTFIKTKGAAITATNCIIEELTGIETRNISMDGYGYGIYLSGCTGGNIHDNNLKGCRHSFTTGNSVYPTLFTNVHHNEGSIFDTHAGSDMITFDNNVIHDYIRLRDINQTVVNNTFTGEGTSIDYLPININISRPDGTEPIQGYQSLVISGNKIFHNKDSITRGAISIKIDGKFDTLQFIDISRNIAYGNSSGMWISSFNSANDTANIKRINLSGNRIYQDWAYTNNPVLNISNINYDYLNINNEIYESKWGGIKLNGYGGLMDINIDNVYVSALGGSTGEDGTSLSAGNNALTIRFGGDVRLTNSFFTGESGNNAGRLFIRNSGNTKIVNVDGDYLVGGGYNFNNTIDTLTYELNNFSNVTGTSLNNSTYTKNSVSFGDYPLKSEIENRITSDSWTKNNDVGLSFTYSDSISATGGLNDTLVITVDVETIMTTSRSRMLWLVTTEREGLIHRWTEQYVTINATRQSQVSKITPVVLDINDPGGEMNQPIYAIATQTGDLQYKVYIINQSTVGCRVKIDVLQRENVAGITLSELH